MADFRFNLLTHSADEKRVISTALGATADNAFRSAEDFGKAVKMGDAHNHVLCVEGDEIEAFIDSVRGDTVNEGFSFGGVSRGGRHPATVGENQGATPVALLDYVVADAQAAPGTQGDARVKTGTPTIHRWRVVQVIGDGLAGSKVILERDV
jgi:hypothetical protein